MNDKIYELMFNDFFTHGLFFYDASFGLFFITDKVYDYDFPNEVSLDIKENKLIINDNKNDFRVYKLRNANEYIYIFGGTNNSLLSSIKYYTFDELNSAKGLFISIDELFKYLSKILCLPNGNYVVSCVQDYITAIEEIEKRYPDKETFFRGHYSYKYQLVPSLYRKKKYYDNENYMYMDFKTQFYNELANKKYIEILTTMQHYKMPTRLLDTTSNPLVALYMACSKPGAYKGQGVVGEVIVMNEMRKNVKYSDSNAITLLSCLSVLETNYKQELYEKINESIQKNDSSIYKNSLSYKRFIAEVYNELPYFDETFFNPEVLLTPKHVRVGMINDRIIAQSGNFILFGLCNYKTGEYRKLNTVAKERIFIVNRDYITKQLSMMNIDDGTMYPDKDHRSLTITKAYD